MHMPNPPAAPWPDIVRDLGFLTLGSRLKRIGERLQAQTQGVLRTAGIDVPASHLPLLAALDGLGPLRVGGLAQALGTSQPGVTRQVAVLQALGLVNSVPTPEDLRQRTVVLTPEGERLLAQAKRAAWPAVEGAVSDACGPGGPALLDHLAALEDALATAPLAQRAAMPSAHPARHAPA